jgi:hypothetical protein
VVEHRVLQGRWRAPRDDWRAASDGARTVVVDDELLLSGAALRYEYTFVRSRRHGQDGQSASNSVCAQGAFSEPLVDILGLEKAKRKSKKTLKISEVYLGLCHPSFQPHSLHGLVSARSKIDLVFSPQS